MLCVDHQARKATILQQINVAAKEIGGIALPDEELLEEVTSLVEWPVVLSW